MGGNRRQFLKVAGFSGLGLSSGLSINARERLNPSDSGDEEQKLRNNFV